MGPKKDITSFFKPTGSVKRSSSENSSCTPNKLQKSSNEETNESIKTSLSPKQKRRMEENQQKAMEKLSGNKCTTLGVDKTWMKVLQEEFKKPYYKTLEEFVSKERKKNTIYPPERDVFSWTRYTNLDDLKVVLIGQDPYHQPNQAHGLCFSVQVGVKVPPSLVNMYKELEADIPGFKRPNHGYLVGWAKQGVLLLNAVLTVQDSKPNAHKDKGWEKLTDAVIKWINANMSNVVFILWGGYAQKKGSCINKVSVSSRTSTATSTSTLEHLIRQLKMEYIMLSISFAFSLLSFILFCLLRLPKNPKYFVHKQLLFSYCAASAYGLLMHDDVRFRILKVKELCVASVVVYQYLSTAMFACMFVEGIHLVTLLLTVNKSLSMATKYGLYAIVAWGLPLLTTVVTFWAGFSFYKESTTCFTVAVGGIWLWKGPIAFFLSLNTFVLIVIMSVLIRKMYCTKLSQTKKRVWVSLRALVVLHPLLGFTFIIGFFLQQSIYIGYVYVVTNNILGVLFFIFHVLLERKLRLAFRRDVFGLKNVQSVTKDKATFEDKWDHKETKRYTAERQGKRLYVSTILARNVIGIENKTMESDSL